MAISTNGAIITRVTSALYGEYLSNASYTEVKDTAPATVAANFMANDFAGKSDLQVATTILTNLGLTSITGLDNWLSAQLTAAGSSASAKGAKLVSILNDYANLTSDATYGSYATSFNAKVSAGLVQSQTAGAKGGAFATADAVTATNATIALTTGLDTGAAFTGGAGNDTFNAVDATTDPTLTDGDSLVGGAGSDTLTLAVASTAGANAPGVSTDGVETLAITQNRAAGYTVDASLMSGLNAVKVTAGAGATTVTNSAAILNTEVVSSQKDVTVTAASTATLGTADVANITLSGTGTTAAVTITNNGVETFNVALTGARSGSATNSTNKVTLVSNELETVNVSGTFAARLAVDLTGADATTQTAVFNAAEASGGITAGITLGGSGKAVITGGAGNDSITVAVTKTVTVTGGAGVDTLVADGTYDTTTGAVQPGANVSGFEKASGTVDQRAFPSNTFTESSGAGSYTYLSDTFTTSTLSSDGTLTIDRATDAAADALTVNLTAATAGTSTITAAEEESITLNSAGTTADILHTVSLSAVKATSLTVTGSNALDAGSVDSEVLATVNASAHTGATFSVNASASNVAMTITGSAGTPLAANDIVNTLTGGSKADTIVGGAYRDSIAGGNGADSISAGAGNDSIDGGSGSDIIDAGEGNNSVVGGAGDDSITAGSGNDLINAGSGDDTIVAGAGNDMIIESSLTDDTNIDGGTGTDKLAAVDATATTFNNTAASLETGFVSVTDDAAPTISGVETAYVSIFATASTASDDPVNLDLTTATALTTLYLEVAAGEAEFAKVTNFKGSSITLFGATTNAEEADELTVDGAGQAALTINLENYVGADGDEDLTVTGVTALTLAGKSKSMFTGTAAQDNTIDALTADSVATLTILSSGSTTTTNGASALTIGAVSSSQANTVNVTVGAADAVTITSITTGGNEAENATVTVSTDGILDLNALDFGTSALDTLTLTVNDDGTLSSDSNAAVLTNELVNVTADSIGALTVTLAAGSTEASLDLSAIEITSGTFSLASGSTLVLNTALGSTGDESSFVFTGRGDLDFDVVGTGVDGTVALTGAGVTFNTSGLTVDADALTVTGTDGADTISTGLGADTITGGAGNDVLSGGAGTDTYVFGTAAANGIDAVTLSAVDGTAISEVLDFQALATALIGTTTEDIAIFGDADVTADVTGEAAGDNILIITADYFANAAALVAATTLFADCATGDVLFIYSSSATANARIAVVTLDAGGDITAATDLVTLTGVTVVEASTGFGTADFITN